jgi:uncharacterized membrane protein
MTSPYAERRNGRRPPVTSEPVARTVTQIVEIEQRDRQAMSWSDRLADTRAKVDLEVDLLAEQEVTKLLNLVLAIHDHLGLGEAKDADLAAVRQRTDIGSVLEEMARREQVTDPAGAQGPDSAADTEA